MKATIDKAGRVVIPKSLRDQLGLEPGEVDLVVDGAGLRIEPVFTSAVVEVDGILSLPGGGTRLAGDELRELRLADQR